MKMQTILDLPQQLREASEKWKHNPEFKPSKELESIVMEKYDGYPGILKWSLAQTSKDAVAPEKPMSEEVCAMFFFPSSSFRL